ncbi:competence protein F [Lacimicrobium alkaliphilum]|uniref:Competence protein F n=1 Tax=Lacimicrobium alkaliphilum TaxID=1526571 RepID=A0ABQ1RTS8_9ALTE|nr:competence protein F [Lacimicrobium alkaliphilum]
MCPWCQSDLKLFNLQACAYNLLLWPKIRQGLGAAKYQRLLACGEYQWPLDTLIRSLKFSRKPRNARALADIFYDHVLTQYSPWPEAIIPVPLSSSRYRTRHYNQAMEIAKRLNQRSGLPLAEVCKRSKDTQPQTELSGAQRRRNLKQAFTLTGKLEVRRVAVVDDIITTGTTINSLCDTLLQHYPDLEIEVWTIAISPLHQ